MLDFIALAHQCAPTVAPQTMAAIVQTESGFNPYAIGVVGGRLQRQPHTLEEAVQTASTLEAGGWNFSVGLAQVNRHNLKAYGLGTYAQAFEPCANLRAGSKILEGCYTRAARKLSGQGQQTILQAAFSCYYSGNFTRGFKPDRLGDPSYVQKVLAQASVQPRAIPVVPAISGAKPPRYDKAATPALPAASAAPAPAAAQPAVPPAPAAPLPPPDHTSVLIDLSPRQGAGEAPQPLAEPPQDGAELVKPLKLKSTTPAQSAMQTAGDVVVF